jgi:rhamnose transport system permease protein
MSERLRTSLGPLLRWETGLALVVVIIGAVGASVSSEFFTSNNIFNLGLSYGEIAIMTLPMTLIVISGEIDLSVASILGMASALLGYLWARGWPMIGIFLLVAVVGLAAGAVNGLLITRLGLPSLAVTIGTLAVYRGIATILLGPATVADFPTAYTNLGVNAVPFTGNDITYSTAIFVVLAIIFGVVLHATPFGRSVYAMGASAEAAQFAGIRVKRIKTVLFMTSGLVCALAGVLLTFRLNTAVQNNGLGLELDVVAIVLLGGVSIFGGKGSIVGVVLGVLAFSGIQNALFLTNFNQEAAGIVTGALLLFSVFARNAASALSRLRAWLPAGRRGRGSEEPTAITDADLRDEARHYRDHLRLGRADLPGPVHQPGVDGPDRYERGRPARQGDQRHRGHRDRVGGRLGHQPERLDRVHEAGTGEVPEDEAGRDRLRQRRPDHGDPGDPGPARPALRLHRREHRSIQLLTRRIIVCIYPPEKWGVNTHVPETG